jgi:signal transduction histidine kinase
VWVDSVVMGSETGAVSETPLCEKLGLDDVARKRRLQFLGVDDDICVAVRTLGPFMEQVADEVVDAFYAHILAHEETARFLGDPVVVNRLKRSQRAHFIQLASGEYGGRYFESRLMVGLVHARIGLEPHWYLGGYLVQWNALGKLMAELLPGGPTAVLAATQAMSKIIMLDMALATDAYINSGFVDRAVAESHAREAERAHRALTERDEEASRREQLLQMVVHDIRSPVTAMMATARVGLRHWRETTEPPGKQFKLIEDSGTGVLRIIDNMVGTTRAAGGELAVKPEAFDVAETVRACADALLPFAEQNNHGLTVRLGGSVRTANLDPTLVRRVVSNLMVNAIRHTPGGTTVRASYEASDGEVRIRVEDDGPGIPRRQRDGLFHGGRGLHERKQPAEGTWVDTGLGLPFCALACHSMGGTIKLVDGDECGACFLVVLPKV